jgi:hypothetical protein
MNRSLGRDQVGRLMAIGGITGAVRGRHRGRTTVRDDTAARHPDLVNRGWNAPTGIDQLWVADFERHEALPSRAVVKGHRSRPVAAGRGS